MSSEVETARGATHRNAAGFLDFAIAPLGMTEQLFARLDIYHDVVTRSAPMNMAIDEAAVGNGSRSNYSLLSLAFPCLIVRIFWEVFRRGDLCGRSAN